MTLGNNIDDKNYAGFWLRFFAACIDMLIYTPIYYGLQFLLKDFYQPLLSEAIFVILALIAYSVFFASKMQGTLGMYILKFRICDKEGKKISLSRAFYWTLSSAIGWSLCFVGIIYLQIKFDILAINDLLKSCEIHNVTINECIAEVENITQIPFETFQHLSIVAMTMAAFLSLIWALSIALPKDKTGFHNLLCGTRFVKK
jgi:uncharacterized RDD family membrane protein YckC